MQPSESEGKQSYQTKNMHSSNLQRYVYPLHLLVYTSCLSLLKKIFWSGVTYLFGLVVSWKGNSMQPSESDSNRVTKLIKHSSYLQKYLLYSISVLITSPCLYIFHNIGVFAFIFSGWQLTEKETVCNLPSLKENRVTKPKICIARTFKDMYIHSIF